MRVARPGWSGVTVEASQASASEVTTYFECSLAALCDDDPRASVMLIERAQRRCAELMRRREALRFTLEALESQGEHVQ
jgi:hypothetical protein